MPSRRTVLALAVAIVLTGCGGGKPDRAHTLVVAATAVPHAEILRFVRRGLAKEGIGLDIRVVGDYVTPNLMVADGRADVNYAQTRSSLVRFNREHHTHLVPIAAVHVEPLGAYSRRVTRLSAIPSGATVALPDEPSTIARALLLLRQAGLITLAADAVVPDLEDIRRNARKLKFVKASPADMVATLDLDDLVFINTNFALAAKLDPTRDALLVEGRNSPFANYLVGLPGELDDPRVTALVAALTSPATRAFILKRYHGAVIPAF